MSTNKKLFLILCGFLVLAFASYHMIVNSEKYKVQEQQKNTANIKHDVNTTLPYTYLNNVIAQSGAGTSVYYRSLVSSDLFYNYSGKMQAEGLIRPYILAYAMEKVDKKELDLKQKLAVTTENMAEGSPALLEEPAGAEIELGLLLEKMVTVNDNTAANMVIDLLGVEELNAYFLKKGYVDTVLVTKMGAKAKAQREIELNSNKEDKAKKVEAINYTSVNDVVNFFTRLYKGECVSKEGDKKILALLTLQRDRNKMGALLPKDIKLAHEVGTAPGTINDAGIVYAKEPYVLAIMTDNSVDENRTLKTVHQISSIVYNAASDKEVFRK